jgi:predicted nucleotidyltransferase
MITEIQAKLTEIQASHNVVILYACESGSRAWGFPSKDSDYDVRFFYVHPQDWYLSIDTAARPDVIEKPVSDQLDISGWDLRKTLQLFYKSNPPLLEWLGSPIVYLEQFSTVQKLRELAQTFYSVKACIYHYLHMAEGNYREYLKGDIVWVKKYFYVLRPILAINWLERGMGIVPIEFQKLIDGVLDDRQLTADINVLLEQKRQGAELDKGPQVPSISDYIDAEIKRLTAYKVDAKVHQPDMTTLNHLFRATLTEVWS